MPVTKNTGSQALRDQVTGLTAEVETIGGKERLLVDITSQTAIPVSVNESTTHTIYNVISPGTANTEFSQALTDNTKQLLLRCRGDAKIQFTFVSGESGTKYITLEGRAVYQVSSLNLTSKTLYMQADAASQVIEIEEWS